MNRQPQTYGAITPSTQVIFSDQIATEFNNCSESVVTNLYTINTSIKSLESALKVIGTVKDNQGVRNQVHVTQLSTNQIASVTSKEIKRLKSLVSKKDKQRLLQVEKLEGNFKEAIGRYHTLQQDVANKQKSHLLVHLETFDDTSVDEDNDKQIQAQKLRELAFEQDMLVERANTISQIESDILDVNQIMRELGSMVHSQRDAIDTIENSIDHTAGNVEEGTELLLKGSQYQNKYRKKLLVLVGIALICAVILIIILIVEFKK